MLLLLLVSQWHTNISYLSRPAVDLVPALCSVMFCVGPGFVHKTLRSVSATNNAWLTLLMEVIAVYSAKETTFVYTLWAKIHSNVLEIFETP
jgi:hypothetical protein